jgi:hypothetical protein
VLAIDCTGGVRVITSHAPAMEGGIGVESAGFVPPGFSAGDAAYPRPEVTAGFHRPVGTPRPKLMTEAK